ncbi:MAG: hypothetical protein BIFFINMI_02805 [Phycisphaerae bacterium]|nr:hypothetical protein [Phycisphaerae bacterium]
MIRRNPLLEILGLALACGLIGCQGAGPASDALALRPFLSGPSPRGMTVSWLGRTSDPESFSYRPADAPTFQGARVEKSLLPETDDGAAESTYGDCVCRVHLTDLQPGTCYRYRVGSGGTVRESSFQTPPLHPEPFQFAIYGDSREGVAEHARLARAMAAAAPAFVLHTGDMVAADDLPTYRQQFFGPLAGVIDHIPLWPVRGNHEGPAKVFGWLFDRPVDRLWYSFDWGDLHVAVLDSCRGGEAMATWLARDLGQVPAGRWKLVVMHHPVYDLGQNQSRWGREEFAPLFRRYGVDLVVSGHSHCYQRFRPLFTRGVNPRHPITYLVSGSAGAPVHRVGDSPYLAAASQERHFVLLEVRRHELAGRALTADGRQIDSFRIVRNADGQLAPDDLARSMEEADFDRLPLIQGPYLGAATVVRLPGADGKMTVRLPLAVGPAEMRYRLVLGDQEAADYQAAEVTGVVAPNTSWTIQLPVRARRAVNVLPDGRLTPPMQLSLEYSFGGGRTCQPVGPVRLAGPGP